MSTPANAVRQHLGLASYETVNRFRTGRGKRLRRLIKTLANQLGRDVQILDVGGRPDYWLNIGFEDIARISLLNLSPSEFDRLMPEEIPRDIFETKVGDARNLTDYNDASIDLVHSNSVIEHVGSWDDMVAMARELLRVGRAGWVQTPAWAFPLEPHFRVPFAHWLGRPMQARMMSLSFVKKYREANLAERRHNVERINLLSRSEMKALFPGQPIYVERVILPKSYIAHWLPAGLSL